MKGFRLLSASRDIFGKVERRAVRREEHIRFQLFQLRERRFKDLDDLRELGIPDVLETGPLVLLRKSTLYFFLSRSPNSSTPCCPACARHQYRLQLHAAELDRFAVADHPIHLHRLEREPVAEGEIFSPPRSSCGLSPAEASIFAPVSFFSSFSPAAWS